MEEIHYHEFWNNLVDEKTIKKTLIEKKRDFIIEKADPRDQEKYLENGWEIHKEYKSTIHFKKTKPIGDLFEDEVWTTMAGLGFSYLNKNRQFKLYYSFDPDLSQQIDVIAADDETILIIECKATDGEPKRGNFKETIEAIGGKKEGILKSLKKYFPNSKHKVRFILATKNYYLSEPDIKRLENFDILHFDDEAIGYYKELSKHLGLSARFQLLGNLFEGRVIPELQNEIPAIEGKMGGHTYYSFSIEPEKLLKVGYILHRNKANKKYMPTYQRLIKRNRLKAVQEFVEDGGFFPNSLIININSSKKLRFDKSSNQVSDSLSKVGVLHLPKKYRSAYIIDGQHRLYGYANSDYKSKNTVPVVAFMNLDRSEQVRIFMDINENQKAVPKNLQNTLNSSLLWDSPNLDQQIKALKLQIAQDLGEDLSSPLYDRVMVGENPKTSTRCIKIESIKIGLDRSNFLGQFSKTAIKKDGTFYRGNNDDTYDALFPVLIGCFRFVKESLIDEWNKGEAGNGYLAINTGIEALIRLFSDIIDHLCTKKAIQPKIDSPDKVIQECTYYLDPLIKYLKNLELAEKIQLKKSYGTGGRAKYWRILQKAISDSRPDFDPPGLGNYWKDEAKRFNTKSMELIREIETYMKTDFRDKLKSHFGDNWFEKGVKPEVQDKAVVSAQRKNRKIENPQEKKEPWDCLNIIDYRSIATYGANWRDIFEKEYTNPNREKKGGNKEEKTKWMQKLEEIRNQNFHEYSVKEDEFEFLNELYDWLILNKTEDEF